MVSKNFRTLCLLRLLLLYLTLCGLLYLLLRTDFYASAIFLLALTAYQLYSLLKFMDQANRHLARFLEAVRYADFSQSFNLGVTGSGMEELRHSFSEVLEAFSRARAEKEEQYRYLQTVVQHVGVGLLCYQADGAVELVNNAALRLLKTNHLNNIKALENLGGNLIATLLDLKAGAKTLVRLEDEGETRCLSLSATELRLRGRVFTLVSIQNIQTELEEKEMEAWQNLVRVLTHEIMNSITPISSLAATANGLLERWPDSGEESEKEILADIREAVGTIQKRSQGLLHFVDTYREMTRIPKPEFRIFSAADLLARVQSLLNPQLERCGIVLTCSTDPEGLELTADPALIEQVLINLVLNAIQALENRNDGRIEVTARLDASSRPLLRVRDNGPGILEEVKPKIFIPFFTTKPGGSGIGLNLARQIMRLHRGSISVQSRPDEGTCFTLRF